MKLYITHVPENAGDAVVQAIRAATDAIGWKLTNAAAANLLELAKDSDVPVLFLEDLTDEQARVVRLELAKAGVRCAVDLPDAALAPPPTPTPQNAENALESISYRSAQFAMAALSFANGNAAMALHHCVLMAHIAGEDPDNPRTFSEAAGVLLDTFPPTMLHTIQETITHYTGLEPEEGL